jgi:hypothetical protein
LNYGLSVPVKGTSSEEYVTGSLSDSSNDVKLSASDFADVTPLNS